jgi:hypothetical protein
MSKKSTSSQTVSSLLSQLLRHPELPVTLYDNIMDTLVEMMSLVEYDREEMIELALAAFDKRESRRKGVRANA